MIREGQEHIPSGCAISGIFSREGRRIGGETIIRSIAPMHDRSNGLGGGFAGYGIYPQYADYYAFHLSNDSPTPPRCERYLEQYSTSIPMRRSHAAHGVHHP